MVWSDEFYTDGAPGRSGNTPDTGTIKVTNDDTEFYTYTADWTANYIKFYVEDKL